MASKLERTIVGVVAVVKFIVVSSRVESRRSAGLVGAWIVSVWTGWLREAKISWESELKFWQLRCWVGAWKEQNWLIFCGCSWVEIAGMQSMSESVVVRRNIFFLLWMWEDFLKLNGLYSICYFLSLFVKRIAWISDQIVFISLVT